MTTPQAQHVLTAKNASSFGIGSSLTRSHSSSDDNVVVTVFIGLKEQAAVVALMTWVLVIKGVVLQQNTAASSQMVCMLCPILVPAARYAVTVSTAIHA